MGNLESLPAVGEVFPSLGRVRCCEKDYGGSHYHCAACGEVTGMYGHYVPSRGVYTCEEKSK